MKYTVEALENVKPGMTWEDLGCHPAFGWAYSHAKDAGNELPNFEEVLWDRDVEEIVEDCRKFGVKEFTISCGASGWIGLLSLFEEKGVRIVGTVKIKDRFPSFDLKERAYVHALIPALKLEVFS